MRKVELGLAQNNIYGEIPPEINNLKKLKILRLRNNEIKGTLRFPPNTGTYLYQSLQGVFPTNIGICYLSFSLVIKHLSRFLSRFCTIDEVYVQNNFLSGSLPTSFYNSVNLKIFAAFQNNLIGTIKSNVSNLTSLKVIRVNDNSFSGKVPDEISELCSLGESFIKLTFLLANIVPTLCLYS